MGNQSIGTVRVNFGASPFAYDIPECFLPYDMSKHNPEGESNSLRLALHLLEGEDARLHMSHAGNVTWNSLSPELVSVNDRGEIIAISNGLAIITAEYAGNLEIIYVRVV